MQRCTVLVQKEMWFLSKRGGTSLQVSPHTKNIFCKDCFELEERSRYGGLEVDFRDKMWWTMYCLQPDWQTQTTSELDKRTNRCQLVHTTINFKNLKMTLSILVLLLQFVRGVYWCIMYRYNISEKNVHNQNCTILCRQLTCEIVGIEQFFSVPCAWYHAQPKPEVHDRNLANRVSQSCSAESAVLSAKFHLVVSWLAVMLEILLNTVSFICLGVWIHMWVVRWLATEDQLHTMSILRQPDQ